jgi:hypothetical protein
LLSHILWKKGCSYTELMPIHQGFLGLTGFPCDCKTVTWTATQEKSKFLFHWRSILFYLPLLSCRTMPIRHFPEQDPDRAAIDITKP